MKTETKINWPFDYAKCMNPVCSKRSKCARHHTNHTERESARQVMFSPAEDKCNSYVDLQSYVNDV